MVNNEHSFTSKPQQGDLLMGLERMEPEYLAGNAPDLDVRDKLRVYLKESLRMARKHGLSREMIVDRMNLCFPDREENDLVTLRQLNGWLATSAEDRPFPLEMIGAFIWATRGNLSPLEVITQALGLHIIDKQELMAAKLGETILKKTQIAQEERLLKQQLGA